MSEGLIVTALVIAVLVGVTGAAFLVMRSPAFWADAGKQLVAALIPAIIKIVGKRMTPEEERAMQSCIRSGGEWDWTRKRCKNR